MRIRWGFGIGKALLSVVLVIPFFKTLGKIAGWMQESPAWLPALALFFLAFYEAQHLPLWVSVSTGIGALALGRWGFGLLFRFYRQWKKRGHFPARRLVLLSLFLFLFVYFFEFSMAWPGYGFLLVVLVIWIFWCLWQRMSAALLATILGLFGMTLLVFILRISALESTLLLYVQSKYRVYHAQKEVSHFQLHWKKTKKGTSNVYSLHRGNVPRALFSVQADVDWFLESKMGVAFSPDYPGPGLYLGSFSQSITDPWRAPSLSFYKLSAKKLGFQDGLMNRNFEKLIALLFDEAYALLKERERQGSIQNFRSLGKVKLSLPSVSHDSNVDGLRGIAFFFHDLSVEKRLRLGLYPLPRLFGSDILVLMSIEEPQVGFPMHPALLHLLESLRF